MAAHILWLSMNKSKLRKSFSRTSEKYEKYRPTYPDQVFEDIIQISRLTKSSNILDVGCGSGKGCAYFSKKGYTLSCLDPSQELLAIAKKKLGTKNMEFINSDFEAAEFGDKKFSLIISASAFHWIKFNVGEKKVYNLLKPNGYFAFFWNRTDLNYTDTFKKIKTLSKKYYKTFKHGKRSNAVIKKLKNSKYFINVEERRYTYYDSYNKMDFVEWLKTISWVITLQKNVKNKLIKELQVIVPEKITVKHDVILIIGKKKQ